MMSQEPRLRTSSMRLRLIQRFRLHGTQSSIRKLRKQQEKAEQRLILLRAELRHQLLLSKELEQNLEQATHRLVELSPNLWSLQENPPRALEWVNPEELSLQTTPVQFPTIP